MTKTIDFYFDVGSPASYLAWTQLKGLTERTGADICWKPMLLGGVFKATGNSSPATIPAKSVYNRMDMARFASRYNVPLNFNPHFPVNTLYLMRGMVACLGTPHFDNYLQAIFNAMWVDEQNLGDVAVVADVLAKAGFNPEDVIAQCDDSAIKESLKRLTEEAVERGVFGAPTFFVGDEMFFGQDRLGQVEECLLAN
ncbi:2-hydroxychromene-2-carboxylate isomerase [Marinobacter salinexigens]|uniref:2-hydroxychromene-2-carboxylate isomerase n=1 Tax=Marinobacter salinexigens TaxID=2919747 RepID=A0A5B0VB86_9GAMM|nr:2-hydroxychromene-2-carboxylate isomerase [Marinobacter salinexigens]KAA1171311.1 2-hydroxychromene-2-carboxylate isomerase [Marinobacter salinexigens]